MTRGIFGIVMLIVLVTASLLSIFTRKMDFIFTLAVGLIATLVLSAIPTWPVPSILPPALGDRPALPMLPLDLGNFGEAESPSFKSE